MPYVFKEAGTGNLIARTALDDGTDSQGRPKVLPVVSVEPGTDPLVSKVANTGGTAVDPATKTDVQNVESAIGDESVSSIVEDPSQSADVQELLAGLLALLRGALGGKDADDEVRIALVNDLLPGNLDVNVNAESVDLATQTTLATATQALSNAEDGDGNAFDVNVDEESADLATQTTLSNVLSELQGALDVSGATVTVTDNGSFNVTLDAQSAGLAQDSTVSSVETAVRDKEHYSDVLTGGQITLGSALSKTADGFEVLTSGTVEVNTTSGTTRQFSASPGRIYPIGITQFTGNTGLAASDLLAWIR